MTTNLLIFRVECLIIIALYEVLEFLYTTAIM